MTPQLSDDYADGRFETLARHLLQQSALSIGGELHRIREVEFYYQGGQHIDPFAHAHPVQSIPGRWYFHREGTGFRGGTYKGLDIVFGPPSSYGGILLRTLQDSTGAWICGSSLCVDHILRRLEQPSVAALDAAVGGRDVADGRSPLHLAEIPEDGQAPEIWATARVGLTLKRLRFFPSMLDYIARPYRFLVEPQHLRKGREYTVVAMYRSGLSTPEIAARTRGVRVSIERMIAAFEEGRRAADPESFGGRPLGTADRCRLLGALEHRAEG